MNYLTVAQQVAREAGAMVKSRLDTEFATEEKSSAFDVVTEIDKASEALIRSRIAEIFPEHKFLGEEETFGHAESLDSRLAAAVREPFLWIVDPIDGTSNFVQRIPGFTVSIALASYGEIVAGVIYDPCRDEMFWAERGGGAYRNGTPIRVSGNETLATSVVATGFPSNREMRAAVMDSLQQIGARCRTIRALGSAALHLAYVACGRLTAFWEHGLNVWDVAAGVLIIREAGGVVTDTQGNGYTLATRHIVGSNRGVHDSLLELLKPFG